MRYALIVSSQTYRDTVLPDLASPGADAVALERVLKDARIGRFDEVQILIDAPGHEVRLAIESLFADKHRDDLVLLFVSGHGIKDDRQLYFAMTDTRMERLRSTAIPSSFVHEAMTDSVSRRQVLLLDCCYSGAFTREYRPKGSLLADL